MDCPEDLSDAERLAWDRLAAKVAPSASVEIMRAWCASVVELRAAEAWVRENGTQIVIRDDKGNPKAFVQAPKYVQVRALRTDLVRLSKVLGLGMASAGKLYGEVSGEGLSLEAVRDRILADLDGAPAEKSAGLYAQLMKVMASIEGREVDATSATDELKMARERRRNAKISKGSGRAGGQRRSGGGSAG